VGGAPGEGEEEDAIGADAALDEVRNTMDERARFARAGPGDDQKRSISVLGRRRLLRVQLRGEIAAIRERPVAVARAVDAGNVWHGRAALAGRRGQDNRANVVGLEGEHVAEDVGDHVAHLR
jgi:hypothetical protein